MAYIQDLNWLIASKLLPDSLRSISSLSTQWKFTIDEAFWRKNFYDDIAPMSKTKHSYKPLYLMFVDANPLRVCKFFILLDAKDAFADILKRLITNHYPVTTLVEYCLMHEKIYYVYYLLNSNINPGNYYNIAEEVLKHRKLESLRFLLENGLLNDVYIESIFDLSCDKIDLEVLRVMASACKDLIKGTITTINTYDLKVIRLLVDKDLIPQDLINDSFIHACVYQDVELAKFILTSAEVNRLILDNAPQILNRFEADTIRFLYNEGFLTDFLLVECFKIACDRKDFNLAKFIFASKKITTKDLDNILPSSISNRNYLVSKFLISKGASNLAFLKELFKTKDRKLIDIFLGHETIETLNNLQVDFQTAAEIKQYKWDRFYGRKV